MIMSWMIHHFPAAPARSVTAGRCWDQSWRRCSPSRHICVLGPATKADPRLAHTNNNETTVKGDMDGMPTLSHHVGGSFAHFHVSLKRLSVSTVKSSAASITRRILTRIRVFTPSLPNRGPINSAAEFQQALPMLFAALPSAEFP